MDEFTIKNNRIEIKEVTKSLTHEDIKFQIEMLQDEISRNVQKIADLNSLLAAAEKEGLTPTVEIPIQESVDNEVNNIQG